MNCIFWYNFNLFKTKFNVNRAFLQEEIDPLTLLEAFSKRGFDNFKEANIEIIPERKLRTDKINTAVS
jgi:hypothetical protein